MPHPIDYAAAKRGSYQTDNHAYTFEAADMRLLESVRLRLYDDKPLTGDQRRDLANTLDAIMSRVAVQPQ